MKKPRLAKFLSFALIVVLLIGLLPLSASAATRSTAAEENLAYDLKTLGLFGGVGTNSDGTTNFDLRRQGTRVEALIMLIRLLGEEDAAKACKDTCIFTDVPEWAQRYVSYGYAKGYTKGSVSDPAKGVYLFGTGTVTPQMFCTFLLRALGYSDTNGADFTWDRPYDLARSTGLLTSTVNTSAFWRADMVTLSYNALFAKLKGTEKPLADKLLDGGVFTETQYKVATCNEGYTALPAGQVPPELRGRKLTDSQIGALIGKDPDAVKAALSTVEDVAAWFDASDFYYMSGAFWFKPDSYYRTYESAPDHLYSQLNLTWTGRAAYLGVDNVSYAAAWLLQDDFAEAGIMAALTKGNSPDYTAAYLKLGSSYYILDFATLISATSSRVGFRMLASVKTDSLYSLASVVRDTGNLNWFAAMGIVSNLDERLHLAKYGNNAEFVQPDKVEVLYSGSGNMTLEEYVIASGTPTRAFSLQTYHIPSGLGGSTLTLDEAKALAGKDAATIAKAVKTVPDMLLYLYATGFKMSNGDMPVNEGSVTWHINRTAVTSLASGYSNCGASANTVRFLLDGDYEEVGFVCHTYVNGGGGGHVYNYIKSGSKYYIIDMTAYTGSGYSTGVTGILALDKLSDYAGCYAKMGRYGDYLPVIYTYQAQREIPMAWNNSDTYTTWFPEGTKLNVLFEDTAKGYSIDYRELTPGISAEIEAARADKTTRFNDMADFNIASYRLPNGCGDTTLTDDEVTALVSSGAGLDTVAGAVKTVGDAMMYLYAAGFISGDGDILTSGSAGQEWRCNLLAPRAFATKEPNCGATANLIRYLLDGDYDDVGYVCHTYAYGSGGGHVYNYVKSGGTYYIVDLNSYLRNKYAPTMTYVLNVGNTLQNYATAYSQMYLGSSIKAIYAYSLAEELPISWSIFDDVYVTYLPEARREAVQVILEGGGYSVGFAPLSQPLWDFINTKR